MAEAGLLRKINNENVELYCNTCLLPPESKPAWRARVEELVAQNKMPELKTTVQIINTIQNGTMDEAKQIYEMSGHFARAMALILDLVKEFCPKGEEFAEHLKWSNIKLRTKMKFSSFRHGSSGVDKTSSG